MSTRRSFLQAAGAASLGAVRLARGAAPQDEPPPRPNILWITCEDMSPDLGCCGVPYARTPHLDRLAAESVRYPHAFATAPVCSPARSCLITGLYATSLGTQNLRSRFPIPDGVHGFPSLLRDAGTFTSNRTKTDYNTSEEGRLVRESWTVQGAQGHWRRRRPGQPFFCVFNHTVTHQSRSMVWSYEQFQKRVQSQLRPEERHDPAQAPVPPYYPDTPIVRRTLARYHDCITAMDKQVGKLLGQLQDDGLADETIVFFFSDHGAGLPRHKRLVLDSGLRVPLLVRFPAKYQSLAPARPGETVGRLVSFVDFAPTVLRLAGLPVPDPMQGVPFLGPDAGPPRATVHGARDRVDEAYDLARSVRGPRFLYVRNYMPHLSTNQPSSYSDRGEIRQVITRLARQGKLDPVQMAYAGPTRPIEELYDTEGDPHQVRNLAASPQHAPVLERMRAELRRWILTTRDTGFLPESEMWARSEGTTPAAMARQADRYPLERILAAAELVGRGPRALPQQVQLLEDEDPAVRTWAAIGLRALGGDAGPAAEALARALADRAPSVRIEAAGALAQLGRTGPALAVLTHELERGSPDACLRAARTLELLGEAARPAVPAMKAALATRTKARPIGQYVRFSLEAALRALGER